MSNVDSSTHEVQSSIERVFIGAIGGFSAILVKYLSQDHTTVLQFIDAGLPINKLKALMVGYIILTPILILLGSIIGWVSEEKNRLKIFALGISAPALITTWAGGASALKLADVMDSITRPTAAFAQDHSNNLVKKGIDTFFGADKEHNYAVHVGSFSNKENAEALVEEINRIDSLRAFTTQYTNDQGINFTRVLVLQFLTLRDALALRAALLKANIVGYAEPIEIRK